MLQIFNTLTRQKETFKPLDGNKVKMYVCGMTVYDYCHIGHARMLVVFDTVVRYLRQLGYDVTYVRNITDIDDKIIKRALENGETTQELTARFIKAMHDDIGLLNVLSPDIEPKATEAMSDMINMITTLIEKDYAYVADNGDVYYDVDKFEGYGKLSHKSLDDLRAGERVEINEHKRNPLDFVVWKHAKEDEPSWPSPWGAGRPGWHIECSAMSIDCLGETIDIHGGGMDLQFPHHENEIAQSEACTGKHFVKTWMHNGFVQVDEEKMSKSLGNFFTLRDVLAEYHPEVIRYFFVTSHYRSQLNYTEQNLETAKTALGRFYTALRGLPTGSAIEGTEYEKAFSKAMDDDFNTPEALAVLFELVKDINKTKVNNLDQAADLGATLQKLASVVGLLQFDPDEFLHGSSQDSSEIEALVDQRNQARANKDWPAADRIRAQLDTLGVILDDGPGGTTWRVKK